MPPIILENRGEAIWQMKRLYTKDRDSSPTPSDGRRRLCPLAALS